MKYRTILIAAVVLLALIAVGVFIFGVRRTGNESFVGELEVWSFEDKDAWVSIIEGFRKQYPDLKVLYVQKNPATYEAELLNALAAGQGPDVFAMHHTWTLRHRDKIAPLPSDMMSVEEFERTFVPVARHDLASASAIYGLPLYVDTLALYYNEDLFNVSGVTSPPRTWAEFNNVVQKTTVRNEAGDVLQAGVGLGTAENVEHASDILAMFMLQNGTEMIDAETHVARFHREAGDNPGENALYYYTNFADPRSSVYTWNRRLGNSLEMFARGSSAMYIGYAADLPALRNASLRFRVAPIPQVALRQDTPTYRDLTFARYFAGTVSQASERKEAAWTFLLFATSHNGLSSYLASTGLPTSRRDLIESQMNDRAVGRTVGIFAGQALTASSWAEPNEKEIEGIFEIAIEDVSLRGLKPNEALKEAARKYNALVGID